MSNSLAKQPSDSAWQPPTPDSTQIGFHSPKLPVDHLVLLPPPLFPTNRNDSRRRSSTDQNQPHPFYPSHLLPPLQLPDASLPTTAHVHPGEPEPVSGRAETSASTSTNWEEEYTKRPRRSAAIVAARMIPRQPSPLELDSDDTTFSPPPLVVPSSTRASKDSGTGGASKRKVSHSLIERRRREKINDCLTTLKETVPNLKEEGEKKIAKAKERGKKRGRGDDAGERGGLHKLEILQGTIEYINELRARIDELERRTEAEPSSQPLDNASSSTQASPAPHHSHRPPSLVMADSFDSSHSGTASSSTSSRDDPPPLAATSMSKEEADHAANMLLYFSTSPELRPVQM